MKIKCVVLRYWFALIYFSNIRILEEGGFVCLPPIQSTVVKQQTRNVLMMFLSSVKTNDLRWDPLCPRVVTMAIEKCREDRHKDSQDHAEVYCRDLECQAQHWTRS